MGYSISIGMNPSEKNAEIFEEKLEWAIATANRRALDPSENVTPNTRSEPSIGVESVIRGIEIPMESHVGWGGSPGQILEVIEGLTEG